MPLLAAVPKPKRRQPRSYFLHDLGLDVGLAGEHLIKRGAEVLASDRHIAALPARVLLAAVDELPLGVDGLRNWGRSVGLELLDTEYNGTSHIYKWRCIESNHIIRRCKNDIARSLKKGYPACSVCSPGPSVNVLAKKNGADEFAIRMRPVVGTLEGEGYTSLEAIAHQLNKRQFPTHRGGSARWYASTVKNVLDRLKGLSEAQSEVQ